MRENQRSPPLICTPRQGLRTSSSFIFFAPPPRGFYQNAVATAAAAAGPLGKNLLVGVDLLNINLDCRVIE